MLSVVAYLKIKAEGASKFEELFGAQVFFFFILLLLCLGVLLGGSPKCYRNFVSIFRVCVFVFSRLLAYIPRSLAACCTN